MQQFVFLPLPRSLAARRDAIQKNGGATSSFCFAIDKPYSNPGDREAANKMHYTQIHCWESFASPIPIARPIIVSLLKVGTISANNYCKWHTQNWQRESKH